MYIGKGNQYNLDLMDTIERDDVFNSAFIQKLDTVVEFNYTVVNKFADRPELITKNILNQDSSLMGLLMLLNPKLELNRIIRFLSDEQISQINMQMLNDSI